jgi:hypothetical protein
MAMAASMAPQAVASSFSVQRSRKINRLSPSAPPGAPTTRALGSPPYMQAAGAQPLPDDGN